MQKPSLLQISFCVSILFHVVLLGALGVFGFGASKPALQQEDNLVTLTLVAAPDEPVAPAPVVKVVAPAIVQPLPVEKIIPVEPIKQPVPEIKPIIPIPQPVQVVLVAKPVSKTESQGDASSAKPGTDAITVQAQPDVEAKPNYLKNPEPVYPELARRRHQEGLVLLAVKITAQGRAGRVEIKKSSGFSLLDNAAVEAVRDWEFQPARIGSLALESEIEVPVRFELKSQ
ncbi:MAG TPA: energy transducer TonB [Verrucomicrobiae bacterium]|jgi:protein TonB